MDPRGICYSGSVTDQSALSFFIMHRAPKVNANVDVVLSVCLSVCLFARIFHLRNYWMDFD